MLLFLDGPGKICAKFHSASEGLILGVYCQAEACFSIQNQYNPRDAAFFSPSNLPITKSLRKYQKKDKKKLVGTEKEGVYLQPLRATPQGVVRSEVH